MTKPIKPCKRCGSTEKAKDGRCSPCLNRRNREYRASQTQEQSDRRKARNKAYLRAWKAQNPERVRGYSARSRERRRGVRRERAAYWAHRVVLRTHGITEAQWDALIVSQCGLCAICEEQMLRPNIDHRD